MPEHNTFFFSKSKKEWDLIIHPGNYTIGGLFEVSNLSGGYHGILKQWWDYYNPGPNVLLISENNKVKSDFQKVYPNWNIVTIDNYPEISNMNDVDIKGDICNQTNPIKGRFDLIINQATIEHVYNPFQAMKNLVNSLNDGGILLTHTHPPSQEYHQYPRDYFRFMIDWWVDLPKYIDNIELLELYMHNNAHVFSCYQKRRLEKTGWLVNDTLSCIPGVRTLWNYLLDTMSGLEDKTNGYTDYSVLAEIIEKQYNEASVKPTYIIRNGTYFRKLNINIPTFCLIQDTQNNPIQTEVINSCDVVVFPSKFTYDAYKNRIQPKRVEIIQNGADFDFFKPMIEKHPDALPSSIIFIGDSSVEKKGFPLLLDTIMKMPELNFCLIMKDDTTLDAIPIAARHRVRMFNKVPMETVRLLINSSVCAICTSGNEEEHISGIEVGACNIPMVTRPVGRYSDDRDDIEWGVIAADHEFPEKIRFVLKNRNLFSPRSYYINKYSTAVSMKKWGNIIKDLNR